MGGWVRDVCSCAGESVCLYCTHARDFPTLNEAADGCNIISWCHCCTAYINWGNIKELIHETEELSSHVGFSRLSHRLFVSAIQVPPWGVGILNRLGSVHYLFITTICIQGTPGILDFLYVSCLYVSWVAHHLAFIEPGIREARTTAFQSRVHIRGKLWPCWAHWIQPVCLGHAYIYGSVCVCAYNPWQIKLLIRTHFTV